MNQKTSNDVYMLMEAENKRSAVNTEGKKNYKCEIGILDKSYINICPQNHTINHDNNSSSLPAVKAKTLLSSFSKVRKKLEEKHFRLFFLLIFFATAFFLIIGAYYLREYYLINQERRNLVDEKENELTKKDSLTKQRSYNDQILFYTQNKEDNSEKLNKKIYRSNNAFKNLFMEEITDKNSLKLVYEISIFALLGDILGEKKFEASDIVAANGKLYIVSDNSWALLQVKYDLHAFSYDNKQIGNAYAGKNNDSQWESIAYDNINDVFLIVAENVVKNEKGFNSLIYEIKINSENSDYTVIRKCATEKTFRYSNKGFEGATVLRGTDGKMYLLGLCEGNHCEDIHAKPGHGRLVLMKRRDDGDSCVWITAKEIKLPSSVLFSDYSALTVVDDKIAIVSQESSALWIAEFSFVKNSNSNDCNNLKRAIVHTDDKRIKKKHHHHNNTVSPIIDPLNLNFLNEGKVYYFPRDEDFKIIYCNIEGLTFINDRMMIAISDKKKKRQPYRCIQKDQSLHIFVLP